jgi:hypothetical protein
MADRRAALGFRHHTGWAVMVALAGDARSPELIERQRVDLMGSDLPREAYHVAAGLPYSDAERLVAEAKTAAVLAATREVARVKAQLEDGGYVVTAAGLAADLRRLGPLKQVLRVHALRHSAEGEMFRAALAEASSGCGLQVVHSSPKEIIQLATSGLDMAEDALSQVLNDLGREAGPPWRQDHRLATLAGMLALASSTHPVR